MLQLLLLRLPFGVTSGKILPAPLDPGWLFHIIIYTLAAQVWDRRLGFSRTSGKSRW